MKLCLAAAVLTSLALTPTVRADRFYFGNADEPRLANAPDAVDGVLLREENGNYVIRIVGGEVIVPREQVTKIDKNNLTVEQIAQQEKTNKERLAAANKRRSELQAAEASASRATIEAAATRPQQQRDLRIVVDFQGILPNYVFKTFDPILDRIDLQGLASVVQEYLRVEVERAVHRR